MNRALVCDTRARRGRARVLSGVALLRRFEIPESAVMFRTRRMSPLETANLKRECVARHVQLVTCTASDFAFLLL